MITPRYVQQQLFHNIRQQLCTSSMGHGVIASSHLLAAGWTAFVNCTAYVSVVPFSGNRQVINSIIPLFIIFSPRQQTQTHTHAAPHHTLPELQHLLAPAPLTFYL